MRKVITAALKPVWVQSRTKSFKVRMVSRVKCSTIRTMLSKLFFFKKDPECQAQVNSIFRKTLGRVKPTNKNNSVRLCVQVTFFVFLTLEVSFYLNILRFDFFPQNNSLPHMIRKLLICFETFHM